MPVYEYKALDKKGKTRKGIVDADSVSLARKRLRSTGNYPIYIRESSSKTAKKHGEKRFSLSIFDRITSKELHIFTRQLATLLGAKIPLVPSLTSLISQTNNTSFKKIVAQIKESVNEGNTLTTAMLERLADFGEKQETLKGKLTAALVYPTVMALICVGVLFILITYIIPNITQVFVEMDRVLPLPTRILIGVSDFLKAYWLFVVILIVALIAALKFFIKSNYGQQLWDYFLLKIPIIGNVLQKIILARFSSTLGSLLESGVGLIASMEIVKTLMNNSQISQVVDEAIVLIREGKSMTLSLGNSPWFPPMFVQMVGVGEQAGTLEKMLKKVADACQYLK